MSWSTHDELSFIENLGRYSFAGRRATVEEMLRGYLEGVRQRQAWELMDRNKIIAQAEKVLAEVNKEGKQMAIYRQWRKEAEPEQPQMVEIILEEAYEVQISEGERKRAAAGDTVILDVEQAKQLIRSRKALPGRQHGRPIKHVWEKKSNAQ